MACAIPELLKANKNALVAIFGEYGNELVVYSRPHLEHVIELPHERLDLLLAVPAVLVMDGCLNIAH